MKHNGNCDVDGVDVVADNGDGGEANDNGNKA